MSESVAGTRIPAARANAQRERQFGRCAAVAAIASVPLALANWVTMFAAVRFDMSAMSDPAVLLSQGETGAHWWRVAMLLDIGGYYLLIVPLVIVVHDRLRPCSGRWLDVATGSLLTYCLIGAIGGAILATAIPPLLEAYAAPGAHRAALAAVFNGYAVGVYRGMWNLLEELLAGVGWISIGLALRRETRRMGTLTLALGAACLVDAVGTAFDSDVIATSGLTVYLIAAPAWAGWLGVQVVRHPDRWLVDDDLVRNPGV